MATVDFHVHHAGRGSRSSPVTVRHHGQDSLAEVIVIRPERTTRTGLKGSLLTMARAFASLRHQAAPVRTRPRPPTPPAPRCNVHSPRPDDAA
jgi:hypothetical protein